MLWALYICTHSDFSISECRMNIHHILFEEVLCIQISLRLFTHEYLCLYNLQPERLVVQGLDKLERFVFCAVLSMVTTYYQNTATTACHIHAT